MKRKVRRGINKGRMGRPPKPRPPPPKRPIGRPSGYKEEYVEQARKLCALGATDQEIADFFGIHRATFYRWQCTYPAFCDALKIAKQPANERVKRSLFQRACGYEYKAVKIFCSNGEIIEAEYKEHVVADVAAAFIWLKNREPGEWKDRHEVGVGVGGSDGKPVTMITRKMSAEEAAKHYTDTMNGS